MAGASVMGLKMLEMYLHFCIPSSHGQENHHNLICFVSSKLWVICQIMDYVAPIHNHNLFVWKWRTVILSQGPVLFAISSFFLEAVHVLYFSVILFTLHFISLEIKFLHVTIVHICFNCWCFLPNLLQQSGNNQYHSVPSDIWLPLPLYALLTNCFWWQNNNQEIRGLLVDSPESKRFLLVGKFKGSSDK
jgi:hypothetical protein